MVLTRSRKRARLINHIASLESQIDRVVATAATLSEDGHMISNHKLEVLKDMLADAEWELATMNTGGMSTVTVKYEL